MTPPPEVAAPVERVLSAGNASACCQDWQCLVVPSGARLPCSSLVQAVLCHRLADKQDKAQALIRCPVISNAS